MEIEIKESQWITEQLCHSSGLDGMKYCALGFMGKALDINDDDLQYDNEPLGLEEENKALFMENGLTSELEAEIIKANDWQELGEKPILNNKKKKELTQLFKQMNHELVFVP